MTREEIIDQKETLVAEQRKLRQAIKILQSDTFVPSAGIKHTIVEYSDRIRAIDAELKELAAEYDKLCKSENSRENTEASSWTVEFDFDGDKTYPTDCYVRFQTDPDPEDVLRWNDINEAKAFAKWYAGKYGFRVIRTDLIGR